MDTTGAGVEVKVVCAVLVHPDALVAVAVYTTVPEEDGSAYTVVRLWPV